MSSQLFAASRVDEIVVLPSPNKFLAMTVESDPNVIYGGDPDDSDSENYASLGDLILQDLRLGENRNSFVSRRDDAGNFYISHNSQINGLTDKTWTFSDFHQQSIAISRALHGAGIRSNDVISVIAENCFELPAIAFGAFFLTSIVAPINVTYTEREFISPTSGVCCNIFGQTSFLWTLSGSRVIFVR